MTDQWMILRMAGPRTLAVMDSLKREGFDVWTPVGASSKRPRTKAKAAPLPVMPTYVFARATHLYDLINMAAQQFSPHPDFSVFRWDGRIPLIADRSLDYLRRGESRYLRRLQDGVPVRLFGKGEAVHLTQGAYAGMSGIVERVKGKKGKITLVCFPNYSTPIEVETLLLVAEDQSLAA